MTTTAPKSSTMEFFKEVVHSVRYNAPKSDTDPIIQSMYILKGALPRPWPKKIKLTIEGIE